MYVSMNSPGLQAKGVLYPPYTPFLTLFIVYGFTPFIPHGGNLRRNLKGQNPSPSNHDHSYGPGVVTVIYTFWKPPATSTLRTIQFQQWEQQWGTHTLVGSNVRTKYCSHTRSRSTRHYKTQLIFMISSDDLWCLGSLQQRYFWGQMSRIWTPESMTTAPLITRYEAGLR